MIDYRLKTEEQETTIRMGRGEKNALIYTSDRLMMARLDKLVRQHPEDYKCVWVDTQIMGDRLPMGKKYAARMKLVKFATTPRLTDEQRAAAAERARAVAARRRTCADEVE